MPCDESKQVMPDLQTALVVRDALMERYGVPLLAYKCHGGCEKWHLTSHRKSGRMVRVWNNLDSDKGKLHYQEQLK